MEIEGRLDSVVFGARVGALVFGAGICSSVFGAAVGTVKLGVDSGGLGVGLRDEEREEFEASLVEFSPTISASRRMSTVDILIESFATRQNNWTGNGGRQHQIVDIFFLLELSERSVRALIALNFLSVSFSG